MSFFPGTANPIFYAQFHMRGGWKNTLITAGGYALFIGGAIFVTTASSRAGHSSETLSGWTHGLLVLQLLILLAYSGFRVSSAVRADVVGKVIESHRLMPLSPFAAAIGYITGPAAQATSLAAVNFVLGLFTSAASTGGDPQRWVLANLMLFAFALMIWTIIAQIAFASRGGFALLLILMLASTANNANTPLLPGILVLTCPLVGKSIFEMNATFGYLTFAYGVALAAQFFVGLIAFIACTRRYRSSDAIGLNDALGTFLLVAWVGISAVGIGFLDDFSMYRLSNDSYRTTQYVATILSAMLLAIIPLSSSARVIIAWKHNGGPTPASPKRPTPMIVTILATIFTISLLLVVYPGNFGRFDDRQLIFSAMSKTVVVIASFAFAIGLLIRWAHGALSKAWLIVIIWLILTWIVPLIGDLIYHSLHPDLGDSFGPISGMSPIAALQMIWTSHTSDVLPGLAFQLLLPILPAWLLMGRRRKSRQAIAPPLLPV